MQGMNFLIKFERLKMKKIICLLIMILMPNFAFSKMIEGGVKFDVDSAREYVQDGQQDNIEIVGHVNFDNNNVSKMVYSYNNSHQIVGITVQYKGESNKAYIYGPDNRLKYVDKYDRDVNLYPHRGYRYNLAGELIDTSLTVSRTEKFRFSPEGKLIAHSINGIIYDENGKVIGVTTGE